MGWYGIDFGTHSLGVSERVWQIDFDEAFESIANISANIRTIRGSVPWPSKMLPWEVEFI